MTHASIADIAATVAIQPGAIVSKVVHRDAELNITVFGIDTGEALTEHTAARAAIVQVVSGRLRFTVDGEDLDARAGFWLHMAPGTSHGLIAVEPTIMVLTLLHGAKGTRTHLVNG